MRCRRVTQRDESVFFVGANRELPWCARCPAESNICERVKAIFTDA